MEIKFRTKKLKTCYERYESGRRIWGARVARKYVQRIDLLQEATDMEELRWLPGLDCHPLKGSREGHWAVKLHDRWRLIFSLAGRRAEVICLEEVSKHYGD